MIPAPLNLAALDVGDLAYQLLEQTSPLAYRLCGGLCLALLLIAALSPLWRSEGRLRRLVAHPFVFGSTLFATLLAYRWPSFASEELCHDEGLHVTIGIALGRDPLPWRAVDGASAGPLVQYPLAVLNQLGFEPSYGTARLWGLLTLAATFVLLWRTIRSLTQDESLSRLAVLPGVAAFALAEFKDYLAYNSEHPLSLLLAASLFFLVRGWSAEGKRWRYLFGLGLCLGGIPLTKLQGAPAGVVLALAGYAMIWLREPETRARLAQSCLLTLAGLLPLIVIVTLLASADLVEFFVRSTFVDATSYPEMMTDRGAGRRILDLGSFTFLDGGAKDLGVFNRALILPALLLGPALLLRRVRQVWDLRLRWLVITSLGFLAATFFGILYPGTRFPHYLLLLLAPLTFSWGLVLLTALKSRRRYLVIGLALGLLCNVVNLRPLTAPLRQTERRFAGVPQVARAVAPYLEESDWLGTWGLDLRYCVQTRRPFHARMSFPFRFVPHVEQREFWLKDYLERWDETRPPCLVATNSAHWRLEYVAPIRNYVLERYKLVDAFYDRVYHRPVRLFVSNARLQELLGQGQPAGRLGTPWLPTCARDYERPDRVYRTLIDFDSPFPDGEDLRAGTDLEWSLVRDQARLPAKLRLEAGTRSFSFLARTVADDDPELARGKPFLEGVLWLRLRREGRVVSTQRVQIGPMTRPHAVQVAIPATGDYELELSVELARPGGVALALLRFS